MFNNKNTSLLYNIGIWRYMQVCPEKVFMGDVMGGRSKYFLENVNKQHDVINLSNILPTKIDWFVDELLTGLHFQGLKTLLTLRYNVFNFITLFFLRYNIIITL